MAEKTSKQLEKAGSHAIQGLNLLGDSAFRQVL